MEKRPIPAEGVYELVRDVENPRADRRSKDFRKRVLYEKGMRLLVRHDTFEHEVAGRTITHVVALIEPLSGWNHQSIHQNHEAYPAIVGAMAPVAMTDREWLKFEAVGAESALLGLLAGGKVTRDDVKAAYEEHVRREE